MAIVRTPAEYLCNVALIRPQKAQKQNFEACNFNVLESKKIEILIFYDSINLER